MKTNRIFLVLTLVALLLAAGAFTVYAQIQAVKSYPEGEAGRGGTRLGSDAERLTAEGQQGVAGSAVSGELQKDEGTAGRSGSLHANNALDTVLETTDLLPILRFSGVTDDGEQGSASRKEATSIHCTNIDPTNNVQVEVLLYQWNGTDVFTGTVNMPPNRSFTFSTQNTTIYFDDVLLGGSPGTPPIFQGSGVVLAESNNVICTAQVLDPLNYPPVFLEKLPMYDENGILIKRDAPVSGVSASNNGPTWLGRATRLNGSISEGSGVTYSWLFGDGSQGSGAHINHIYPDVGTFTAVLTVSNDSNEIQATTTVHVLSVNFMPLLRK